MSYFKKKPEFSNIRCACTHQYHELTMNAQPLRAAPAETTPVLALHVPAVR